MKIALNHIGLNIHHKTELDDFYQDVLGLEFAYNFELQNDLGSKIFGIEEQAQVFHYKNEHLNLELFLSQEPVKQGFSHICIELTDRETIAKKAEDSGYPITRLAREDKPDILFISDKAGNIFELKKLEQ